MTSSNVAAFMVTNTSRSSNAGRNPSVPSTRIRAQQMGSIPHSHAHWVVIAILAGSLYLIFDAARFFAQQLSPVRLRRITGDPQTGGERRERRAAWTRFDAENFQLVSGALLQVALLVAFAATSMTFDELSFGSALLRAGLVWGGIVLGWKFILAMVPENIAELVLRGLIPVTHFFVIVFWPILYPLRRVADRLDRESDTADEDEEVTDEEVQAYIDVGEEEGILEASEGRLLQSIVDFGDRVARELMTPRIDVLAYDAKKPLADLARLFSDSKYSRIPIYQDSIDTIVGFVHIKEIFDAVLKGENKTPAELARPPYFVSETKKVSDLLKEFQTEHLQVAVVVDEYGGTAGIITIEDVVEEIVGDIADEHEDEDVAILDLGERTLQVSGLVRVEELEDKLGADLTGEDYETVAGLIFTTLGRVPGIGTVVKKNGFRFEVERADRRRIYRVKVSPDPDAARARAEEDEA
ncbi:MAG TPA: hemolysin family protein [Thermoanaerobaculia bacterium]|nr:hemolysin family protein [Thermoanaerobaculia bacterium]